MAGDDRMLLIRHLANRGVGAAIVTGYQHAIRLSVDFVVVLAGDGQMDPGEIERLLEPLVLGNADYVKGNRLGHPELQERMPASRRLANRVLTRCTRWVVGDNNLNDSQCGYTAITRYALQRLPLDEVWPRYGYPNDLLGRLREAGLRVVDRPVTPIYGEEVSGIRPLRVIPTLGYVLARAWLRRHVVS
jgi:glycosyltransferase involved in cell wall biosynthesis